MYRVIKEKGNNVNITLENTETKASIVLGRVSMPILKTLEDAGHVFDATSGITMKDRWDIEVNNETGKELAKHAMPLHKPVRDQRKVKVEEPKKDNKQIDAMDVLLGLANYN